MKRLSWFRLKPWLYGCALLGLLGASGLAEAGLTRAEEELNKGVKLIVEKKPDEALRHLQAAVAADPKLVYAHYNLGVALKMAKRYDQAVASFRQAYSLAQSAPVKAQCLYGIGLAFEEKKAWRDAVEAWQAVIPAVRGLPNESRLMPIVNQKLEEARKNAK